MEENYGEKFSGCQNLHVQGFINLSPISYRPSQPQYSFVEGELAIEVQFHRLVDRLTATQVRVILIEDESFATGLSKPPSDDR